jgi:hypothetical protein
MTEVRATAPIGYRTIVAFGSYSGYISAIQ